MNLFWSFYNLGILTLAGFFCVEQPRFRGEERFDSAEWTSVRFRGREASGTMRDLSLTGCQLNLPDGWPSPDVGEAVRLGIPDLGVVEAQVMRIISPGVIGVRFADEPELRAALTRKVLGGGYARPVGSMRPLGFLSVVARRFAG
jgi:PilZ domain